MLSLGVADGLGQYLIDLSIATIDGGWNHYFSLLNTLLKLGKLD